MWITDKKAYILSTAILGLFCFAQTVFGQITNPISAGSFGALFAQIAAAIGTLIASLGGIMFIVSGILYVTSGGSPEKMGTAKKALMYAIIGIVVGLSAGAIVDWVKSATGM